VSAAPPVRIHFCHPQLRPLAERMLPIAVRSYQSETGSLGFPRTLPDTGGGGPELDIYLVNLGRGGRAQANDEGPDAARAKTSFIVIDYLTTEANDFLASYIAHELNHVLQYVGGVQVTGSFAEATAAYVDDVLFPRADMLPSMVADFQSTPYRPVYFHDERAYDYGSAIFVAYLVKKFGMGIVRDVFAQGDEDPYPVLSRLLAARSTTVQDAVRKFATWRVRTGRYHNAALFPNGARLPEVTLDHAVNAFDLVTKDSVMVRPRNAPQHLGSAFVGIDLTTPFSGGLAVTVTPDAGAGALAFDLLESDRLAPLAGAVLKAGSRRTLCTGVLRPGARLWLVVTNLGTGTRVTMTPDREATRTQHGFTAAFTRLPESSTSGGRVVRCDVGGAGGG
jgi:hypothetical protein